MAILGSILIWFVLVAFGCWALGGIYYYPSLPMLARLALLLLVIGGLAYIWYQPALRHFLQLAMCGLIGFTFLIWLPVRPQREAAWTANHAIQPMIEQRGEQITIRNLRHTVYESETEYSVQYLDREFELSEVSGVWFCVQRFTSMNWLAHTFLCFEVQRPTGPEYFSVSVEVRCAEGEQYSPFHGLYRHYELLYTIADERDGIGFRTVTRAADRVYLYRCNATAEQSQAILLDIMRRVKRLDQRPEFYNTLLNNCTNNLVVHANQVVQERINLFDLKVILPGWSAQKAYKLGLIGREGESFETLERRSRIDEIAKSIPLDEQFSVNLRNLMQP